MLGVLTVLPALVLPLVFGGLWGIVALGAPDPKTSAVLGVTFGVILLIVLIVLAISGALSIGAGLGVLKGKRWGDALAIIASFLHIANVPIGTAVSVFTLWVLLIREPRESLTSGVVQHG